MGPVDTAKTKGENFAGVATEAILEPRRPTDWGKLGAIAAILAVLFFPLSIPRVQEWLHLVPQSQPKSVPSAETSQEASEPKERIFGVWDATWSQYVTVGAAEPRKHFNPGDAVLTIAHSGVVSTDFSRSGRRVLFTSVMSDVTNNKFTTTVTNVQNADFEPWRVVGHKVVHDYSFDGDELVLVGRDEEDSTAVTHYKRIAK